MKAKNYFREENKSSENTHRAPDIENIFKRKTQKVESRSWNLCCCSKGYILDGGWFTGI